MAAGGDDPSRRIAGREMGEKLQKAMNQLPEKQRLALVMFTIEEMPQKAVAEALECSVEAVKWHVFQGRKKLRELLGDYLRE
jgi:RNA polymerase sigma-70 factor (ECF subfamily)